MFNRICLILLSLVFLASASFADEPPTVADSVDLQKYQGTWYEIAAIPMYFERKCVANTQAEYTLLDNGKVKVRNSCEKENGERMASEGRAKVTDPNTNAKLEVAFVNLFGWWIYAFGGDYWVIALDEDYQHAIVGHPDRKYGWILAREKSLSKDTLTSLANTLSQKGYDPCEFISMPQTTGLQEKTSLCELAKPE